MNLTFNKITSITKVQKTTKVVNFSVNTNENYFANGVLTHNCYMKRHLSEGLSVAKNTGEILSAIDRHAYFYADADKPNQTHDTFMTYDISCLEDFALHSKYYNWQEIFKFFVDHPIAMATLATKYVPTHFLDFNPEKKVRIRFSLMPHKISSILEPNTSKIIDRIKAVDAFIDAGYDVHLNFSPVVVYKEWLEDYKLLFEMVDNYIEYKDQVKAEVIFLTHNESKHLQNLKDNLPGEELLYVPSIQEEKTSEYGGKNLRYKHTYKSKWIKLWTEIHDQVIPFNTIRYIF